MVVARRRSEECATEGLTVCCTRATCTDGDPLFVTSANGRRVNLGAYGNTPWATMSKGGTMLLVK